MFLYGREANVGRKGGGEWRKKNLLIPGVIGLEGNQRKQSDDQAREKKILSFPQRTVFVGFNIPSFLQVTSLEVVLI